MIYFDNASTTKVYPEVAEIIAKYNVEKFFNPSSLYLPAIDVKKDILNAKEEIKKCLGANQQSQIIFLSSATEANNLALFGLCKKGKKILVSQGEHASVFNTANELLNLGFDVDFIKIKSDGKLDIDDLKSKINNDVGLISFMNVSNETGAINNIKEISNLIKTISPETIIHCDGVQAFCKIYPDLKNTNVDAYTISSHKIHGPKGVGALWLKPNLKPKPQIWGGGQENGLRSGTENTAGIMGFVTAAKKMFENMKNNYIYIENLRKNFIELLKIKCNDWEINGSADENLPHILSISFKGIKGETLLHMLEEKEIFVSTGSACNSKHIGNRVLQSMGKLKTQMEGNIRISFSETNTLKETEIVVEEISKCVHKLRELNY